MINNIPDNNDISDKITQEFSEDVLNFLILLVDEYLRLEKLNKAPPE
ncbi:hypothetical protein IKP85_02690 [bacterium]|nr:hypothetical protein [bacterium]